MSETGALNKSIVEWLTAIGIFAYRNNVGRKGYILYGCVGAPDIMGILPDGIWLGIETKKRKEKMLDTQISFRERIDKNNGIYIVALTLYQAKDGLRAAGYDPERVRPKRIL